MEKESSQDLTIETERVDDVPVLLAQMEKMGVAELLDEHVVMHGNWGGLSFGRYSSTKWWMHKEPPFVVAQQAFYVQAYFLVVSYKDALFS